MRLALANPADVIGITVIHDHRFWRVDRTNGTTIDLASTWSKDELRLPIDEFRNCRVYLSQNELRTKYPRLIRAMRWASILTDGEATSAIYGYQVSGARDMGSEAVAHAGGSRAVIRHAIRCRHVVARQTRAQRSARQEAVCA